MSMEMASTMPYIDSDGEQEGRESDEIEPTGVGRGNSLLSKADYKHTTGTVQPFLNYNPEMWEKFTGCSKIEFEKLFELCKAELKKPIDEIHGGGK